MEFRKAYFHTLDKEGEKLSIELMQNLVSQFHGQKIIIAIPIKKEDLTDEEKIFLTAKKFVMNDVEGTSYNVLAGKLTSKGSPGNPNGLDEPAIVSIVNGKGSPTDPKSLPDFFNESIIL